MRIRLPSPSSPGWVLAESVAAAVLSLLSMVAIGRVIGPHATGLGTVAIAAFLSVEVFGAVLFPDALVQLPGLVRRHSDSAVTASVLVGAVLGLWSCLAFVDGWRDGQSSLGIVLRSKSMGERYPRAECRLAGL